jgi:hypothetical protein
MGKLQRNIQIDGFLIEKVRGAHLAGKSGSGFCSAPRIQRFLSFVSFPEFLPLCFNCSPSSNIVYSINEPHGTAIR